MPDMVDEQLDFWDFSIAELSAEIILKRYRFAKLISCIKPTKGPVTPVYTGKRCENWQIADFQ